MNPVNSFWIEILNQGLNILLQASVLVLLYLFRQLVQKISAYYESHTSLRQRELLTMLGHEAFTFAETVYRNMDRDAKLNEALRYLLSKAEQHGLSISMKDARAVIEKDWLEDRRRSGIPLPS
ncbi:hypothetical protein DNHGIG_26970 [Collibacillus ludicampi]|uniref:Phage holin n=1 Tax=Collibacillus ludicampi TaxID=2771369 RepID=A0AAV4LHE5_9BACL|nr:hypothetical protein DNHGIG_26970 [Collibacillus ludicampi]